MTAIAILLSYAVLLGLVAVVYAVMCTEPGEIFSGLYKFLKSRLMGRTEFINKQEPAVAELLREDKVVYVNKIVSLYGYKIFSWTKSLRDYEWIFKPLIGCERCVAGQLGFWLFIPVCIGSDALHWTFFNHIIFICISIYFSTLFKTIYLWNKNYQKDH